MNLDKNEFVRKAYRLERKIKEEVNKITLLDKCPQGAMDFSKGVSEFTISVVKQADEKGFVTPRQLESLENMLRGLKQWTKQKKK